MPVLFTWGEEDYVSWADLFNWTALALCPAETKGDDKCLAKRMRVPGSSCARLEAYRRTAGTCWLLCLERLIKPHRSGKPFGITRAGSL